MTKEELQDRVAELEEENEDLQSRGPKHFNETQSAIWHVYSPSSELSPPLDQFGWREAGSWLIAGCLLYGRLRLGRVRRQPTAAGDDNELRRRAA